MDQNFQQLHLQSLIDLLAEETEKYTKAFISGTLTESAFHKANIDALVTEINRRKQEKSLPPEIGQQIPPDTISDASPTTTQ
jgi:hypothetical protein